MRSCPRPSLRRLPGAVKARTGRCVCLPLPSSPPSCARVHIPPALPLWAAHMLFFPPPTFLCHPVPFKTAASVRPCSPPEVCFPLTNLSLTRPLTHPLIRSLTHSLPPSLTHPPTHSHTYSLTHLLTHSLTHPLTHLFHPLYTHLTVHLLNFHYSRSFTPSGFSLAV